MLQLKSFVGLKKYTNDPSSMSLTLFGHHLGFVGDVKDGTGEINKFDWACLVPLIEVNVFKEKYYKTKIEENQTIVILPPVKDNDTQQETISVRNVMYNPFCLVPLVLDKDLNPQEAVSFDILDDVEITTSIHITNKSTYDCCRLDS